MVIVDPLVNMIRVMLNVAVNCVIPALAARRSYQLEPAAMLPHEGAPPPAVTSG